MQKSIFKSWLANIFVKCFLAKYSANVNCCVLLFSVCVSKLCVTYSQSKHISIWIDLKSILHEWTKKWNDESSFHMSETGILGHESWVSVVAILACRN